MNLAAEKMPKKLDYAKQVDQILMKISKFFKKSPKKTAVLAELEQKLTGNCIKIKQFKNTL